MITAIINIKYTAVDQQQSTVSKKYYIFRNIKIYKGMQFFNLLTKQETNSIFYCNNLAFF